MTPNNYSKLSWDETASTHAELNVYNISRDDEHYLFKTQKSIYNLKTGSRCKGRFFIYE